METFTPFIYGRNPVQEALETRPHQIEKIYLRKGIKLQTVSDITHLASAHRIPVSEVPGSKLFELLGRVNDQGVAAAVSMADYLEFEEWIQDIDPSPETALLLLDEIEDPHNFGAILRTAAAAGMSGVIVPKHRQAPVSAVVYKTSAGTAGRVPIIRAVNLNQAILILKQAGFWIAGLDSEGDSLLWEQTFDVPMAFVIGNEGKGMRRKTSEHCDFLLSIPMDHGVESLNASVSAGLVCYEWRRQRRL